jgi:F-type H+-transporting ATPase subunit b
MDQTLNQLRELLLGSIPTIVLFTITYVAYRLIVHGALVRVLEERRARTQGAIEKAQQDIAAAEAKTAEYEAKLREARMQVYRQIEARRRQWNEERAALVQQTRKEAEGRIRAAREAIQQDVEAAKAEVQVSSDALAQEVVRSVLGTQVPVGAER